MGIASTCLLEQTSLGIEALARLPARLAPRPLLSCVGVILPQACSHLQVPERSKIRVASVLIVAVERRFALMLCLREHMKRALLCLLEHCEHAAHYLLELYTESTVGRVFENKPAIPRAPR